VTGFWMGVFILSVLAIKWAVIVKGVLLMRQYDRERYG
jgi:hypothetical protein